MQIGSRLYWSNDNKYVHPFNEIISKKKGVKNGLWSTTGHVNDRMEKRVSWVEKSRWRCESSFAYFTENGEAVKRIKEQNENS